MTSTETLGLVDVSMFYLSCSFLGFSTVYKQYMSLEILPIISTYSHFRF
uniref:Uncharacterized protein n=1 Tax=Arundo donax TaxID=35708 RepID=A0A0A9C1J3_ARUDO